MPETTAPLETLRHRAFVRALAVYLVRDPSQADDLEQEVWLAALQRPPREAIAMRAWISSTLRRVVGKKHRGEERRRARETVAATPEAISSSEDLVERIELEQRVVRAVMGLRQRFRLVILMRYYEDLPSRAIAERLGISDNAVRARLSRGLRELREILDDEASEDHVEWRQGLIVAYGLDVGSATTAASTLAIGTPIMNTPLLCAAALTLVSATTYVVLDKKTPVDVRTQESAATAPHVKDLPALEISALGPQQPDVSRVAVEPKSKLTATESTQNLAGSGTLSLRVFDLTTGDTIDDYVVRVMSEHRFASIPSNGASDFKLTATTYDVAIRALGYDDRVLEGVTVTTNETTALGDIGLSAGRGVIRGRLLAPHLDPNSSVIVELYGSSLPTRLQVPTHVDWILTDITEGEEGSEMAQLELAEENVTFDLAIDVARSWSISAPSTPSARVAVTTPADGTFHFGQLPVGRYYVRVVDPESQFSQVSRVDVLPDRDASVNIELPGMTEVSVAFNLGNGAPILPAPDNVDFAEPPEQGVSEGVGSHILQVSAFDNHEHEIAAGFTAVEVVNPNSGFEEVEISLTDVTWDATNHYPASELNPVLDWQRSPSDQLRAVTPYPQVDPTPLSIEPLGGNRYGFQLPRALVVLRAQVGDHVATRKLDLRNSPIFSTSIVLE